MLTEHWPPGKPFSQSIFLSQTLIRLNRLMIYIFCSVQFYETYINLFNNSCLSSSEITISSTFLEFSSITGFRFTVFSAILFPTNSSVASAVVWTTFLEAVFWAINPVFVTYSKKNFFLYLLHRFLANDKNPYSLIYLLVFGSYTCPFHTLISNVRLTLSSICNGLPFWVANVMIISFKSVA